MTTKSIKKSKKITDLKFLTPITIADSKLTGYVNSNREGRPRVNLNKLSPYDLISIINTDSKYPLVEFLG